MAKEKHYIEMTASECRLAYVALMQFRNDIIQRGIDPVDLNSLILRLVKMQKNLLM
jgi:hypothetical protein